MKRPPHRFALVLTALFLAACHPVDAQFSKGGGVASPSEAQDSPSGDAEPAPPHGPDPHAIARAGADDAPDSPQEAAAPANSSALDVFQRRILPILNAQRPSSCTECHLSGVDLKDYIQSDQAKTFAALVAAGLIDVKQPAASKILSFIERQPDKPSLITDKVRREELEAFRAWIQAAVNDPALLAASSTEIPGPQLPVEVIRHARKDRVLASFIDNIWAEVGRCTSCHSPDQNQKQVEEHGEQVSWIKLRDPQATLNYMIEADLFDVESPERSLVLLKPTMQVEHGGGQKMVIGDRTYRQFRRFLDDYAAVVHGKYQSADELPSPNHEVSVATSMSDGIWLKLEGVPARYDQKLLQVDLYRREGTGWSETRWATADRAVAGNLQLWQQTLSLTAPRESPRADELRRTPALPPGEYLVKIFIDAAGRLTKDARDGLGPEELVGEVSVTSRWPTGYGRMTVIRFPQP